MKKVIYLHVGAPKTGTTAIQKFLSQNKKWLIIQNFFYPYIKKRINHTVPLRFLSIKNEKIKYSNFYNKYYSHFLKNRKNDDLENEFEKLKNEIIKSKCNKIILSNEDIFNPYFYDRSSLERVKNHFIDFDIRIVLFLREPISWLKSHYAELLQSGKNRFVEKAPSYGADDFIFRTLLSGAINYEERILDFETIFGAENISIVHYEDGLDSIESFLEVIGCSQSPSQQAFSSSENIRPTWFGLRIVRWVNNCPIWRAKIVTAILAMDRRLSMLGLRRLMDSFDPFSPLQIKLLRERVSPSWERVVRRSHRPKKYSS